MIYKPDGTRYFMAKFMWKGRIIRKSTRCANRKDARAVEGRLRAELARGNFGILEATPAPTVADFLKRDFLPYTESKFEAGSKTLDYYSYGAKMLTDSDMASLPLDKITDQHARGFEARYSHLEASTINCGLRTLRRALALASDWSKIDRKPKISLAKNENRRDRVLSKEEALAYLAACPQPWRDAATIILGTGARPEEVYRLRWEQIEWRDAGGIIYMPKGKTPAAERPLPLLPEVHQALLSRHEIRGYPVAGWVFPSESASGHLMQGSAKGQHGKGLQDSGVKSFAPYTLRHTGLTWIAPYCDAYTLAKIAGHTSITMTARYIHPQQNAIERTFANIASGGKVVTDGGHSGKLLEAGYTKSAEVTPIKSVA